jgi:hypothetical protein
MDELELLRRKSEHELAWLPQRIDVDDTCCVRICDRPAVRASVWPPAPVAGAAFEVFALCDLHAAGGWD